MRPNLVPESAARSEESRRRNDPEEASGVHHAQRAPRILRPIDAHRANELHWQEFGARFAQRAEPQSTERRQQFMYSTNFKHECPARLGRCRRSVLDASSLQITFCKH